MENFLKYTSSNYSFLFPLPLNIDLSPFQVIDFRQEFDNEDESFKNMKNYILDLGFKLDQKTLEQWDEYIIDID